MDFAGGSTIFVIVLAIFAIVIVSSTVKIVPQGNEFTVERFGRYIRTLTPGLSILVPLIDRVGARLNMMEQVLDVPSQEVITARQRDGHSGRCAFLPDS